VMRPAALVGRAGVVHGTIMRSRRENVKLNLPNALSLFRIFLVPFLVVVLLTPPSSWPDTFGGQWRDIVALSIFLIATATDFLDGWLARRRGQITKLGTLLDPIADKLLISAAFISLVEMDLAPAWMVVVVVAREFAVSGLRSIAATEGIVIAASGWGKTKMVTQITAISLLILSQRWEVFRIAGKVTLWAAVAVAMMSATEYFVRFLTRIDWLDRPLPPPEP
jgi:CDP-diacylglycerol--glycerol-3-phosphate 3-phosphatidyltransferase